MLQQPEIHESPMYINKKNGILISNSEWGRKDLRTYYMLIKKIKSREYREKDIKMEAVMQTEFHPHTSKSCMMTPG